MLKMKRALGIRFLIGMLLLPCPSLAVASEKWDSLNLLKNVYSATVDDGFIIRLEFEKPVTDYNEPEFFDKSVQIDFPLAFIKPAKKYFPANSFYTTKVFAAQFTNQILRIRFLKKSESGDLSNRFHIAQQGRFMIVRFDQATPIQPETLSSKIKNNESYFDDLMTEDELTEFLARASNKLRAKETNSSKVIIHNEGEDKLITLKKTKGKKKNLKLDVKRAGIGIDPIVSQIKKVAQGNTGSENSRHSSNGSSSQIDKKRLTLKDSRPTGKPIEIVPSSLKMLSMLALVLGIMFLLFFGFKKYVLKNTIFGEGEKLVNVLGSGFIGPKKNIVLVEVAGEVLVLGMSQDNISLLTNITDPEKIQEIKATGGKGGSGLNWNIGGQRGEEPAADGKNTEKQFSNYFKQFSGQGKSSKEKSVADVTDKIRQQMGRFKNAKA